MKDRNFGQKSKFLSKIEILSKKNEIFVKNKIFVKNRSHCQKYNYTVHNIPYIQHFVLLDRPAQKLCPLRLYSVLRNNFFGLKKISGPKKSKKKEIFFVDFPILSK